MYEKLFLIILYQKTNESLNIDKVAYNENSSFEAVAQLNSHKYIPGDTEDYYLGKATGIDGIPHMGEYFTVFSDYMKLEINLTSLIDTHPDLIVDINVYKYGESVAIFTQNNLSRDTPHVLGWIPVVSGCDYRVQYACSHNHSGAEPLEVSGDIDVYISTNHTSQ